MYQYSRYKKVAWFCALALLLLRNIAGLLTRQPLAFAFSSLVLLERTNKEKTGTRVKRYCFPNMATLGNLLCAFILYVTL